MVCFQKLENSSYEAMKLCVFLNLLSIIDIKTGIDMSLSSSLNSTLWIATGMIIISINLFIFEKLLGTIHLRRRQILRFCIQRSLIKEYPVFFWQEMVQMTTYLLLIDKVDKKLQNFKKF